MRWGKGWGVLWWWGACGGGGVGLGGCCGGEWGVGWVEETRGGGGVGVVSINLKKNTDLKTTSQHVCVNMMLWRDVA